MAGGLGLPNDLLVKNTDTMTYELRGYYHMLQPKVGSVEPRSYGQIGGWIGSSPSIGAMNQNEDDFTPGFRKIEDRVYGEITRPLRAALDPGFSWKAEEPGLVIFTAPTADEEEFYCAAQGILADLEKDAGGHPKGRITYKEKKPEPKSR
jgi:hypothetical protein